MNRNRNHIKFLNFPGTQIPDPFSCVRATDGSARRLQRITTSVKKSSSRAAPRRTRQATRSSAKSGDSNTDDAEPEPEPERTPLQLYDQAALADLLCISKKSVQNICSKTPWLLPAAIQIPGARGPRWTPESVQEWLQNRPQHTSKPLPVAPKRKVGRPRIALAVQGGAA
ncbi:hypothetical protein BBC27_08120 [Acidithiobacillus ferrivorans]|uniref:Uncharacterized protein n=1 Tax=Acidithiobacillus ferrivorans TaxID=160808 RepID=A0A1B9C0D1_9PROT|nr:hypothetical protein [Acidithiobacillus ferrivorans]OCB03422.1 hypothetical protein BBC27_08120 [Acidithiobacillus ferrivorans]